MSVNDTNQTQPVSYASATAASLSTSKVLENHPPGYRKRRGQNWFFLGLTYASYYLCRYNLDPVAPELMRDLNIDKDKYGLIKTGRDGAYAVGQMVNGLITDRLGGKLAMTIGALGTIVLNLLFGLTAISTVSSVLWLLVLIRSADGFMQAYGAPGFIKINTAWFRRKERGGFAGIFGAMINLGQAGASQLAKLLATGFALPLLFFTVSVPKMEWQYVFFIPPVVTLFVIVLLQVFVKNTPEEAGFNIEHDHDDHLDPNEKVRLRDVFRKIASNPVVWYVAGAYFCTGFVRGAIVSWWSSYIVDVWHAGKSSYMYDAFAWGLPITATVGSMFSGYVSDVFCGGRRAPVAATLYVVQTLLTVAAIFVPHGGNSSPVLAVSLIIIISMMCNSTHSILGTAAAMDLGGRKMAGCSSGIIDSFQYYGSMLSGYGLGLLFKFAAPAATTLSTTTQPAISALNPTAWFVAMIPFGVIGASLMVYVSFKHSKSGARGA